MAHTASDIAKWFLQRNDVEMKLRDAEFISHLKLQKLLYYAQGVYLGFYDKPLFSDELVAWDHGPVVEEVYHEYKGNGSRGIEEFIAPVEVYCEKEEEILEMVYNHFGQYSAWMLRNKTHNEKPWQVTLQNHPISLAVIRDYFREEYVDYEEES